MAITNPKVMRGNPEHGVAFGTYSADQIMMIGYSEDYDLCKGKSSSNSVMVTPGGMAENFACRTFLNKSIETLCDKHKYERKLATLTRVKAGRLGLQGDRVDVNAIKRI